MYWKSIVSEIIHPPIWQCLRHHMLNCQIVHLNYFLVFKALLQWCKYKLCLLLSIATSIQFCSHKPFCKFRVLRIAFCWQVFFHCIHYFITVIFWNKCVCSTKCLIECICLVVANKSAYEIIFYNINYLTELLFGYIVMGKFSIYIKNKRICCRNLYSI